ncbi:MAG: hypothetical protein KAR44_14640, partial [Candidatus Aegiribacteria sp.]|nr:hypothetical protein [Candidatus Aegiribacteria sp.]
MNQTVTRINRIPMPKPEELDAIPPFMSDVLEGMKGNVPFSDYKNFSRLVVDLSNGDLPAMRRAGIKYGNPRLQAVADSLGFLGEYNPERIPVQTFLKMRLDPQISIALALIKLPIIAQNFRIESESEECSSLANAILRPIYRDLIQDLMRHIDFGFATGEKEYDQRRMKITRKDEEGNVATVYDDYAFLIRRVKFAHPVSVRIIRDKKTEEIKAVTQNPSFLSGTFNLKGPKKIPIKKCMWHAPSAEYGNFFGCSRLKSAYQPWYWGQVMLQFMMRYLERRGGPSAYGKAPPGHTTDKDGNKVDNLDIALKTAESLISNSAVAIPSQFDKRTGKPLWDVGLIQDDQRGDMFIAALQYLNVLKARGMWIPERTFIADGSTTNATAESHTDIHLMSEESEIQYLENTINTQFLPDIVKYNFPEGQQSPCFIKIDRLTHSRKVLVRDIFVRMLILA